MPKNLDDDDDDDDEGRNKKDAAEEARKRSFSSSPTSRQGETNLSKLRETSSIPISHHATDIPKHQREEEGRA